MSLHALFKGAVARLGRKHWGASIPMPDGTKRDTGVNELAQEISTMLRSQDPIEITAPIQIVKNFAGPVMQVFQGGDGSGDGSGQQQPVIEVKIPSGETRTVTPGANQQTIIRRTATTHGAIYVVIGQSEQQGGTVLVLEEITFTGERTGGVITAMPFDEWAASYA